MIRAAELSLWLTLPNAVCSMTERVDALDDFISDGTLRAISDRDVIALIGPAAIATTLPSPPSAAA